MPSEDLDNFAMSNTSFLINVSNSSINTTNFLENHTLWKNSYTLSNWPYTRLNPCWTLDLPEEPLSTGQKSTVMTYSSTKLLCRN